ncbi:type II toxin-antitoxin system prevent-host-death family antitoxin [Streptomyces sp. NPDC002766]|uniref:type II toxin-antitoxin system prevent-host-death family antitoxin n=1 Tax=Streptomyces sp. NPDC002766 TaxID=3154429 RepID=UPI0033298443
METPGRACGRNSFAEEGGDTVWDGPGAHPRIETLARSSMCSMEITVREFGQKSCQILAAAAGGTVAVTKNGIPVARVVPINDTGAPPCPTDAMGDFDLPDLDLPDLTDDESGDAVQGMAA